MAKNTHPKKLSAKNQARRKKTLLLTGDIGHEANICMSTLNPATGKYEFPAKGTGMVFINNDKSAVASINALMEERFPMETTGKELDAYAASNAQLHFLDKLEKLCDRLESVFNLLSDSAHSVSKSAFVLNTCVFKNKDIGVTPSLKPKAKAKIKPKGKTKGKPVAKKAVKKGKGIARSMK